MRRQPRAASRDPVTPETRECAMACKRPGAGSVPCKCERDCVGRCLFRLLGQESRLYLAAQAPECLGVAGVGGSEDRCGGPQECFCALPAGEAWCPEASSGLVWGVQRNALQMYFGSLWSCRIVGASSLHQRCWLTRRCWTGRVPTYSPLGSCVTLFVPNGDTPMVLSFPPAESETVGIPQGVVHLGVVDAWNRFCVGPLSSFTHNPVN